MQGCIWHWMRLINYLSWRNSLLLSHYQPLLIVACYGLTFNFCSQLAFKTIHSQKLHPCCKDAGNCVRLMKIFESIEVIFWDLSWHLSYCYCSVQQRMYPFHQQTLKKNFVAHLSWEKNYIYYSQYTKLSKSEATIAHSLPLTLQLNNT